MIYHSPNSQRRNFRTFIASLLAYMLLTSQLAPVALAFNAAGARKLLANGSDLARENARDASPQKAEVTANPYAPVPVPLTVAPAILVPNITATKVDTYPSAPGGALPGEIIRYTVTITNNGTDATNVTLTDTVDVNTAIVGTPKSTPIGFADAFSVLGNVRIQVPDGASDLLANDRDPDTDTNAGLVITTLAADNTAPFSGSSAQGGQVTAASGNGSFEYNPPPGFTGADSFTYIVGDVDGNSQPVTVTLTITGMIWFVQDGAAAGGDGRLTTPFNCFVGANCFDDTTLDDPGDNIFLYSGNYIGGQTLLNNQKLIGQGATAASLATIAGVTVPTFSDPLPATGGANPSITTAIAATNAITLGQGNTLRGFTIGNTTGAKIFGNNFGTLTAGNNDLLLNGTGQALNLTTGTFAATSSFTSITTTSSTAQGIALTSVAGTAAFGSTTVSGSTTQGILVTTSTADINFGNTTVGTGIAGSGGTLGISLQSNGSGTRTFGTLTIQNNTGPANSAFLSFAGGNTVAGTTNISAPGTFHGIEIQSLAAGTSVTFGNTTVNKNSPGNLVNLGGAGTGNAGNVTFNSLGGTNTNGPGLVSAESTGTITVTTNAGSLTTTNGAAVNIIKLAAPATPIALNFTALSSTNSGNVGVNLDRVSGNMTVTTTTVSNSTGTSIQVQNTSAGGTINFGTTSVTGSGNANVDGTGTGVFLNADAGNVTFGDLDISPDNLERALHATNNIGTITSASGDITATGNVTIEIAGLSAASRTPLAMVLNNVDSTNSNGIGVNLQHVSGNLTVNDAGVATNISNPTGVGIQVQDTAAAGTMNFGNTNVSGSGGTSVALGIGAGNGNGGAVTFADLDISPDSGQRALHATNNTGAIASTSGTIATTNQTAVEIVGVSAGSRTPLNIQFTTVGVTGGGVSATGIVLQNTSSTGAPGGFNVVGSGGTCTFATATCTGGRITTTTGADNNVNAGIGVKLTDVAGVSLTRMRIDNHPNFAIRGRNVSAFSLLISVVDGNNGTSATADTDIVNGEDSIRFINLTGSALIDDCFIGGGFEQNIRVLNDTGTLNRLTISDSSVGDLDGAGAGRGVDNTNGDDNINLEARTVGTVMNVTLTNNILNNARGDVIQTNATLGTTMDVVFRLNRVTNNHPNKVVAGGGSSFTGLGSHTYDISCNSFRDSNGIGLNVFKGRPGNGQGAGGTWSGTIFNNTVGVTGVQNSGAADGASGINVDAQGNGTHTVLIKNNVVRNHGEAGIRVNVVDANTTVPNTVTMNATVIGNLVAEPDPVNGFAGFFAVQGAVPGADANTTLNLRLGSQPTAAEKNNLNDGSAVTNDAFLQRAAGAIGVFNLSRAGSASGTASGVVIDDNIVNAASVFTDAGIVLVNPNPALPAAINEACTPPTGPEKIDGDIPGASGDMQTPTAPGEINTPGPPAQQAATSSNQDSILSRPFISSPRPEAVKATTKPVAQTPAAPPVVAPRVDKPDTNSTRDTSPPKPKESPGATPPVIGPGGTNITWNVGTLPAGQSVTLIFDVQVESPYTGPPQVSNQGTITFGGGGGPVLTDDPSVFGPSNPTVTPIAVPPDIFLRDAKVAEPTSGTTSMLFTVALSAPAGTNIPINYSTTNGSAVEPGDYVGVTGGSITILAGEQIKVIPITVNSDVDNAEVDENFTLTITANPALANIVDGTGVGTITVANDPGTLVISEVRTSGPSGAGDEYVEIYNNNDTPHTVAASDASPGYGVFKMGADCNATPVLVGTIPNGTVIPSRGHYLLVGAAYSLAAAAAGNLTLTSDIENDRNVSLFSTTNILQLSTTTRFDAVGFGLNTGAICDLQREGTNLGAASGSTSQYTFFRQMCAFNVVTSQCRTTGKAKDDNDNLADFAVISTTPAVPVGSNAAPVLGAPGPENLASPIRRDPTLQSVLLDQSVIASLPPNRVRVLENDGDPFTTNGTLSVRRRIINNTGAPVTRLRIRVVEITTFPSPGGGVADVRAITSVNVSVPNVNDAATCTASGAGPPPCTVTVKGTTLETPPAQPNGGGYNSTLADLTITPGAQLAPGASANVQFLLAVQTTGTFRFLLVIEALP